MLGVPSHDSITLCHCVAKLDWDSGSFIGLSMAELFGGWFWNSNSIPCGFPVLVSQYSSHIQVIAVTQIGDYSLILIQSRVNYRSRFPIIKDDLLCQFCIRTAFGSAITGNIIRIVEMKVDTISVHICSGYDPNRAKGEE